MLSNLGNSLHDVATRSTDAVAGIVAGESCPRTLKAALSSCIVKNRRPDRWE